MPTAMFGRYPGRYALAAQCDERAQQRRVGKAERAER